ncbi:MAG TPA: tetratricopeptide repeat protein [Pyrinomonadaceae bacterium]|nr:tetratricopeptide repeat protein [Pyrinomonadaceae bacterium]
MARTTKKRAQQLKHDKFRDATMRGFDRLGDRLEGKGRTILYALAALVAAAALFGIYNWWSHRRAGEASQALGRAIEVANAPVVTGTPIPGETGPTFPSERERAQKAVEEFQKVAADYGDPHRELARYFAAVNLLTVERERGLAELDGLTKSGNEEVAARARFALAQAKEADKDYDGALALYNQLLGDKSGIVPPDTANFRIASVYEKQGKMSEAADILFRIADEARKAKGKDGKPAPVSTTARRAADKLQSLDPDRHSKLPPEPTAAADES